MASNFRERFEKTKIIVNDANVSKREALLHFYYWVQFERAIVARNRAQKRGEYYQRKLNTNLEVFQFRSVLAKEE